MPFHGSRQSQQEGIPHRKSSAQLLAENEVETQPLLKRGSESDGHLNFVEDRKGDRRNLEYGPDRYAAPRFHSAGRGGLLGLGRRYRITRISETRRDVEDVGLDSSRRSRKASLLSNSESPDASPVRAGGTYQDQDDLQHDYIAFDSVQGRKRRRVSRSSNPTSSDDEEIEDLSPKPEGDDFDAFKNNPIHQRQMQLSKATAENPQAAQVWLDFIDFQDLYFDNQTSQVLGTASSRSLIDLKISLYERALERVTDQSGKEKLILGLMHEGRKIWDAKKQASQWQVFLHQSPSFDLWVLYLNFSQTNAIDFSSEGCLKVYQRLLETFRMQQPGRVKDSQCIYIILRLSLYLWQIDFTELAIGLWQGLLELCFFSLSDHVDTKVLALFEEFWDTEAARIGEDGATGWASGQRTELQPHADPTIESVGSVRLGVWSPLEIALMRLAGRPARSLDEINDEDPYRIVLFSDIKAYLFSPTTKEGVGLLLDAFLLFSGLNPASSFAESQQWQKDPFIYSQNTSLEASHVLGLLVNDAIRSPTDNLDASEMASEGDDLAKNALFYTADRPLAIFPDFVRRTLHHLTSGSPWAIPRDLLMKYDIDLEAKFDLKAARKLAKTFLRQNSNSLRLYHTYALLECQLGNMDAAEKVWSTALSMQTSMNNKNESVKFAIWRDWAWSYMLQKLFHRARSLLTMIPGTQIDLGQIKNQESKPAIPAQIKTEQFIKLNIEAHTLDADPSELVALIDLLALHKYLNSDFSLELAVAVYSKYLVVIGAAPLRTDSRSTESVHERRALFLHAHATAFGMPFRPKELTQTLTTSIQQFPDNLKLLQLHHYYTQRSGVLDRLRQFDLEARSNTPEISRKHSVIPDLFRVSIELSRPSYSGSTDHSVRSAFQRATEPGSTGIYCVNLWKTYILWEMSCSNSSAKQQQTGSNSGSRSRTLREVFYRALRACPGSKQLFMLAFTESAVADCFSAQELKQVYQTMAERGLRLRLDISDNLE